MKALKVIKKVLSSICYKCNGTGLIGMFNQRDCPTCVGTGKFKENFYYHIYKGQAFNGDTLK